MAQRTFKPNPLIASSPRTGDANRAALFRGNNMWIRGSAPLFYAECYAGSLDLGETRTAPTITGTIGFNAGSVKGTGSGTSFLSQLHIGQFIYAGGYPLVVDEILSDTAMTVTRAPDGAISGASVYQLPVLQNLDGKRATFIRGSLLHTEQGNILGVGDGEVRVNGAPLSGSTLNLKRRAQLALYDPATGNFTVYDLGFTAPTGITAASVAAGTKMMTAGARSFRICKARKQTGGFGNPSLPIAYTLVATEKPQITFPAMDAAEGQTAWNVFGTLYESGTSLSPVEGPWYLIKLLTDSDVPPAGGTYDLEYLNSEVSRSQLLSFDNTAPPDAEFVAALIGYPIWISCQGQGTTLSPGGTSPGPFIIPGKPNNIEAAPLSFPNPVAVSPLETIIGFLPGSARIFLMTKNHLNFASFTGNANFPVTSRPYWERGFTNPYSLIMVGKEIFGSTPGGIFRSAAEADEAVTEYDLGADVEELLKTYNAGHRMAAYDPQNEAVCVFYSGAYKNDNGFWVSICLPFLLKQNFWSTPIVIGSNVQDMIVSGVATVGRFLEFVAGGRSESSPDIECKTYRFDTESGEAVPWYMAWSFSDDGAEQRSKVIKGFRVTGKTTDAALSIHGSRSNSVIDVAALEADATPAFGPRLIGDSSDVKVNEWDNDMNVRELLLYTPRISGTWNGVGEKDRIDELVLEVGLGGFRK